MTEKRTDGPTSPKQRAANQANAQASTGPFTATGKATSAANSLRHGLYARTCYAVRHGALAEDPADVEEFLAAVISDLAPEGLMEQVLAEDIALALLRHRRHGRLESLLLSRAGRPISGPELLHPDIYREARLRQDIETLRHFMAWLTDSTSEVPASAVDTLCGWLRPSGNDESLHSLLARGARDESAPAAEPTTAADRLARLTADTWPGDGEAGTAWAQQRLGELENKLQAVEGRAEELAAGHALHNYIEQLTRVAVRLDHGLDKALNRYAAMKDRRTSKRRNEPSS